MGNKDVNLRDGEFFVRLGDTEYDAVVSHVEVIRNVGDWPLLRAEGRVCSCETRPQRLRYRKVIYNKPATIVLWEDGSKTVVKCDGKDEYNPVTGLALCFMKKSLGNNSRNLNDILHKEGF